IWPSYLSFSPIEPIIRSFPPANSPPKLGESAGWSLSLWDEDAATLESSGVDHLANNASEITDNGNAAFVFHAGGPDDSEETRRTVIGRVRASRSEEHTSELQSRSDIVCRL